MSDNITSAARRFLLRGRKSPFLTHMHVIIRHSAPMSLFVRRQHVTALLPVLISQAVRYGRPNRVTKMPSPRCSEITSGACSPCLYLSSACLFCAVNILVAKQRLCFIALPCNRENWLTPVDGPCGGDRSPYQFNFSLIVLICAHKTCNSTMLGRFPA